MTQQLKQTRGNSSVDLETYTYGADRQKLSMYDGLDTYYYFWANGSIMAEYLDRGSPGPRWTKSYFYAGSRLIFTTSRMNSTTEKKETHHPDRLGTKIVTNVDSGAAFEQSTLPFGTAFGAESSGYSNQVFTSYDRSAATGLDYANNRTYSSGQGRFTQVDPIGMSAATIGNPQSNNLYAYVQNMPTDFVDPSGLNAQPHSIGTFYVDVSGNWWDGLFGRVNGGWDSDDLGGGGGFGPGDDFGGNGGGPGVDDKVVNKNCAEFVAEVERIRSARPHQPASAFVTDLFNRFGGRSNEFGSEGFKKEFRDDNQARHYVGGLRVAHEIGASAGLVAMNAREYSFPRGSVGPIPLVLPIPMQSKSNIADMALNAVSVRHGGGLKDGTIKPFQLPDLIKKEVCE